MWWGKGLMGVWVSEVIADEPNATCWIVKVRDSTAEY